MESLYRFFLRYHVFLIFLLLEGISFRLIYSSSNYQQSKIMAQLDAVKARSYTLSNEWTSYFGLKKENEHLASTVNQLHNELDSYKNVRSADTTAVYDTTSRQLYYYTSAEVINNTTNRQNNNFIINIGSQQGIKPEMGVISNDGVVGIVRRVSGNFSTVMSVLNTDFRVSAKLKRTGHFGPLIWDGISTREAVLIEVPQHAAVSIGDTIVTSGYSSIFPEGIMIGTVTEAEVKKGNFYEIRVLLSADLSKLRYVNVINSSQRNEIKEHEDGQ